MVFAFIPKWKLWNIYNKSGREIGRAVLAEMYKSGAVDISGYYMHINLYFRMLSWTMFEWGGGKKSDILRMSGRADIQADGYTISDPWLQAEMIYNGYLRFRFMLTSCERGRVVLELLD